MPAGDIYRAKAIELDARARIELNSATRVELEQLAKGYMRLADQADRNSENDIVYEPPADPLLPPEQIPVPKDSKDSEEGSA